MAQVLRPDIDIDDDVLDIIVRYPPLAADRHHINIKIQGGVVYITGHTSTPINRKYLADRIGRIPGVIGASVENFFDDVTINLEAGQLIPNGVIANSRYGTVVLSGSLPVDADPNELANRLMQIPGVRRVITMFNQVAT